MVHSIIFNQFACHDNKLFFRFNVVYALMAIPSLLPYTVNHHGLSRDVNTGHGTILGHMPMYLLSMLIGIFLGYNLDRLRRHNFRKVTCVARLSHPNT